MRTRQLVVVVLVALLALAGCQRGPAALVSVSGKVSYKGVVLSGGTIVFTPDSTVGASGPIAYSKISASGSYSLSTGESAGAIPGKYRVTVVSRSTAAGPGPGDRFVIPASLIPEKYSDPDLAQLTVEVQAGRANAIDFNLD